MDIYYLSQLPLICNIHFTKSKYTKWYFSIISKALQRGPRKPRKDDPNYVYYEAHHILPNSIFPEYSSFKKNPWNKVLLTPREHFIVHLLLALCFVSTNQRKQMTHAAWWISHRDGIKINSRIFQMLKTMRSDFLSKQMGGQNNPSYNKIPLFHPKTNEKILCPKELWHNYKKRGYVTVTQLKEVGEKISKAKTGFKYSEESKNKMSESAKRRMSDPTNNPFYGKTHSNETKKIMREIALTRTSKEGYVKPETTNGRKWIKKNDQKDQLCHPEEVEKYLSEGWSLGRNYA